MTFGKINLTSLVAISVLVVGNISFAADNTVSNRGVRAGELAASELLPDLSESDIAIVRNIVRVELTDKEIGTVVPWENSESGNSGLIILQGTSTMEDMACREITYVLSLVGESDRKAYNLNNCLRPDGTWMYLF